MSSRQSLSEASGSDNEMTPISVLMSVYNGARWLDEVILSVLHQTHDDFEFLIVNDGSTDESLDIINRFATADSRIVVIDKPNTGLADSLNWGIRQARGDWIARIDVDDICEPCRLEKQYALAQKDSSLVLIGTRLRVINDRGVLGKVYCYPATHKALVRNLILLRRFFPHSSAFYRTETVRGIGGYRTRIQRGQDLDLWLRLSVVGEFACLSEPLVRLRLHADQISLDDDGKPSNLYSYIAMVSHFLCKNKFTDPVDSEGGFFEKFRDWVEERLEEERVFEFHRYKRKLTELYNDVPNPLVGIIKMIKSGFSRPSFMGRFLWHKIVGNNLARRLAKEWMVRAK